MYDIITFGSAAWDVFLKSNNLSAVKNKKFISQKGICFNLGSKIEIDEIYSHSGGGGTNTAATFSSQGFKTAYCGMIGNDLAGEMVLKDLKDRKIDTSLSLKTKEKPTNYSVVLKINNNIERTILVFRGAAELLRKKDIPWDKIKRAKWFYLAPLSGDLAKITKDIIYFARKNKIKIAFNPGNSQLLMPNKELKKIINLVDVLILNQEEASILTGINYNKEKEIFRKIDDLCPGIAIMTKGGEGVTVSDGKRLFSADGTKDKIIDNTGAGDAFGSGFVAGFIKSKGNIEYSIQLAMANSISCLGKWGAKGGLLENNQRFKKVKVKIENCLGYNCKIK